MFCESCLKFICRLGKLAVHSEYSDDQLVQNLIYDCWAIKRHCGGCGTLSRDGKKSGRVLIVFGDICHFTRKLLDMTGILRIAVIATTIFLRF